MSGSEYAALCAAVMASLAVSETAYGRHSMHTMKACPACKIHVCLNHHDCPKEG